MYKLKVDGEKVFIFAEGNKLIGQCIDDKDTIKEYFFANTENEPYSFNYKCIKNLINSKIPEGVKFFISRFDKNKEEIEEFKVVPYPFDYIEIYKINNKLKIKLIPFLVYEEWEKRWSIDIYFKQLKKMVIEDKYINVIIDEDRDYYDERFLIEYEINEDITINEVIKYVSKIIKDIINDAEISLSGLSKFQEVINIWNENKGNISEEFWQTTLMKYSLVIAQIFSLPLMIFQGKAYIGGKDINNSNGGIIDFVYKNSLTSNIALIEIKTPQTPLIGKKYRNTYSLSNELSGGINQLLLYKDSCYKDFVTLARRNKEIYEPLNPKCILIVGNIEGLDIEKRTAFELFRNELKSIEIITFDELFEKVQILLDISRNSNY